MTWILFFETCKYLTVLAYNTHTVNDVNFDYITPTMNSLELDGDVPVSVFYSIEDVYTIYALRCRKVYLDEEKYALRMTLDYYEEMRELLHPNELDFDLHEQISYAKYYLEVHPDWK